MAEQYILLNDIIDNHELRMDNLKKYYPFFKLQEMDFAKYKDGRYNDLDMGYITLASLRFFIDENNFNERRVDYGAYRNFISELLIRDFSLKVSTEELDELVTFIFDRLKNDGKPFYFKHYDPKSKTHKVSRIKLIESEIEGGIIYYRITAEGVEFYLDTKEVKDESKISIEQLLLEKMIHANNFRGGIDVVRRINGEVSRMALKKQEVIKVLESDVYEGAEAYDRYIKSVAKWFDEEERLFMKNRDLIETALNKAEGSADSAEDREKYYTVLKEIYELENELKKTIERHAKLIAETVELSKITDDYIKRAKLKRLRPVFDFEEQLDVIEESDDARKLLHILNPLFDINIKKTFDFVSVDRLLSVRPDSKALREKKEEVAEESDYICPDDIEEERISDNYHLFMVELMEQIKKKHDITLTELNPILEVRFGEDILANADYYSFLVHLAGRRDYSVEGVLSKQDTFLDGIIYSTLTQEERERYGKLKFKVESLEEEIEPHKGFKVNNLSFNRTDI